MKILHSILLCGVVSSGPVWADTLNFSFLRDAPPHAGNSYRSISVDPTTGKYYERTGRSVSADGPADVIEYANKAAFEAGIPSGSVTLQDPGFYGTYAAVSGGKLFGRTGSDDTSAARFNLATGAIETSVGSYADVNGLNDSSIGFDWGGYTALNFLQDSTGMYLLAKDLDAGGQTWQLDRIDSNLNVIEMKKFVADFTPGSEPETLGFAAMIDGVLFMGNHHDATGFDHTFDFATGQYASVDFDFVGAGATHNFDNVLYSAKDDALYLHNFDDYSFYKLDNAAPLLGRQAHTAPEGGSGYVAALLLLCAAHRFISLRSAKS
jgi:autoaggregation protein RapA/B/C